MQVVDGVNDALMYECKGLVADVSDDEVAAASAAAAAASPDPALTREAALSLHSRPGAPRVIVLDFDGHVTAGTQWNTAKGVERIVTPPYDKDGRPDSFSPAELSDIAAIHRAVSEDWALWDVDVTTQDPGDAALEGVGVRVAVGGSTRDWYGNSAGGVAYMGSWGKPSMGPCFVFPGNLGPNYAKYIWEAVSHEVRCALGTGRACSRQPHGPRAVVCMPDSSPLTLPASVSVFAGGPHAGIAPRWRGRTRRPRGGALLQRAGRLGAADGHRLHKGVHHAFIASECTQ